MMVCSSTEKFTALNRFPNKQEVKPNFHLWKNKVFFSIRLVGVIMGIHFNHKSKAGDRKMQKELKLKMKAEARKQKRQDKEQAEQIEEMRKLEELTRPDKPSVDSSNS